MQSFRFRQVDVFSSELHCGNPVAVVHDADNLSEASMAVFARWTNLSETTFILQPTQPGADYRLRIFTPGGELPFAGHPTLGSCHAWLEAGGKAGVESVLVQECPAGLVSIRRDAGRLAFAAPPLLRSGPLDAALLAKLTLAIGLRPEHVIAHQWVDNGPGWCALLLDSAERVLSVNPDFPALGDTPLGLVGPYTDAHAADFEVRAFVPSLGVPEDPVTGSLNASIAQWLIGANIAPARYMACQGTAIGRRGRVHISADAAGVWVGGDCQTLIEGQAAFSG
ncbi:MAG: PhzF family phenazine biosynthesis protein [Halieaceae bacterium]|jgi:PhzF family phenazine biosynthesis protein